MDVKDAKSSFNFLTKESYKMGPKSI